MKKITFLLFLVLGIISQRIAAQGSTCGSSDPFCTGSTVTFPANTGVPDAGSAACLGSTPNPAWYYLNVANSGDIVINIAQTDASGSGQDVDFICYGPYSSLATACSNQIGDCLGPANNPLSANLGCSGMVVDCSYSINPTETCGIVGAVAGEWYMLCLTNFADVPANVTFSQSGGTGSTNCAILCAMSGVTATPGVCVPATNTFIVTGTINYTNPPTTGTLTVTNSCSGVTQVFNPPFPATSTNYSLAGLPSTGAGCSVTAVFSADPLCTFTQNFTTPAPCVVTCAISAITTTATACNSATQQYGVSGNISFSNPPTTGTLVVTNSCGGAPVILNPPFVSPMTYSFTALNADGLPCTITAAFSDSVLCTLTQSYTAPAPCPPSCNITLLTAVPSVCDPATNNYTVGGSVNFTAPPASGTLTISSSCGGTNQVFNAPFVGPLAYNLTGLTSNGSACVITAVFSASPSCTLTQNYTAPASCTSCPVTATNNGPQCTGLTLNLFATTTAGATYSWTGPGGFTSTLQNPVLSPITAGMAGNYTVTISTTSPTCSSTSTTTFVLSPNPIPVTCLDQTIYLGETATIFVSGGTSYNWSPVTDLSCSTCDTTLANPTSTTDYCVVVTDAGCMDSSCVRVNVVLPCPSNRTMEVPNAFTPNNDGNNDQLCLNGWDDCISDFSIMIFDRWGEKLFSSNKPDFCWNGVYKGKLLDPGVYVYFIKAKYLAEGSTASAPKTEFTVTKKGNITLLR